MTLAALPLAGNAWRRVRFPPMGRHRDGRRTAPDAVAVSKMGGRGLARTSGVKAAEMAGFTFAGLLELAVWLHAFDHQGDHRIVHGVGVEAQVSARLADRPA